MPPRARPQRPRRQPARAASRWPLLILALIVLGATAARVMATSHRNASPTGIVRISGDELVYIQLGDRIWREGRYTAAGLEEPLASVGISPPAYLASPIFKHPPLFPALLGASRALGGGTLASAYWPVFLLSAVSIAATYWLAIEIGVAPRMALVATALLGVSPVHFISSTRLWLDLPAVAFMLLGLAAGIRATGDERGWPRAAAFWTAALMTKYVAGVAWIAFVAAALWSVPAIRRSRRFWVSQSVLVVIVGLWALLQLSADGVTLTRLGASTIDDWRRLSRAWPMATLVTALSVMLVIAASRVGLVEWLRRQPALVPFASLGMLLVIVSVTGVRAALWEVPWAGWADNILATSHWSFYLVRPILFEPVFALALVAALVASGRTLLIVAPWAALLIFFTAWGNYQLRYGLPLMPLAVVLATGAVARVRESSRGAAGRRALAAGILVSAVSFVRAVSILVRMGTDVFYF